MAVCVETSFMLTDTFHLKQAAHVVTARVDAAALTSSLARELVETLRSRFRYHGATCFALDMSRVEFADSACLGAMVGLVQDLAHIRGHIALTGCRPNVAFLFKTTRLDTIFMMYDDLQSAVNDLQGE